MWALIGAELRNSRVSSGSAVGWKARCFLMIDELLGGRGDPSVSPSNKVPRKMPCEPVAVDRGFARDSAAFGRESVALGTKVNRKSSTWFGDGDKIGSAVTPRFGSHPTDPARLPNGRSLPRATT